MFCDLFRLAAIASQNTTSGKRRIKTPPAIASGNGGHSSARKSVYKTGKGNSEIYSGRD